MDFLALVKRLAVETGTELDSKIDSVAVPPATSYGETTEHRSRLVNWIRQAWVEIQEDQDQWDFMIQRGSFDLVKGQLSYDPKLIIDTEMGEEIFDEIVPFVAVADNKYIWITDGSYTPLVQQPTYYVKPEFFFGSADRFNTSTFGMPKRWSIQRNGCIVFDTNPDKDDYKIEFEFRNMPQELAADADIPRNLPKQFHMVIVYFAMVFYAGFDETAPQFTRAQSLYKRHMNKLRLRYLRDYSLPGTRN